MLVAPQTISSGSDRPSPSVTRVSDSRSARGCLSTARSSPTTTFCQSAPHGMIALTSIPSSVRRSASCSGVRSNSTNSRSHESGTLMSSSELLEESEVVLEEEADVGDAVLEHLDPLRAHPEGEALVALRVEPAVLEDDGMDHAGAEDRHPAGAAACRAAGATAHEALDVERDRRLRERVVAG